MSVEVQLGWPCQHFLQEEPVRLEVDRRTLFPSSPVASALSVRILVNDSVYIPSSGLDAQAILVSSTPGPYRIQRCQGTVGPDGNLFRVTTGEGTAEVRLPLGSRVTLAAVQRALRLSGVNDLVVVTDRNGALTLVERASAGPRSFLRVAGQGARSLSFLQDGARGTHVYPPWELIAREDVYPSVSRSGALTSARYPRFRKELRGNPTIKVTYTTNGERCPRCGGTYVENDYRFDPTGEIILIQNEDLLVQACLKSILTVQGSNSYHPLYGSKITTRIGRKIAGSSAMLLKEDVVNALNRVVSLQQRQGKYQAVQNRERVYSIENVDVRPTAQDPTIFVVDVTVRNASNRPVSLSTVFSVPGTIALGGSLGGSLGVAAAGLTPAESRKLFLGG